MKLLAMALLLVGCAAEHSTKLAGTQPRTCSASYQLVGNTTAGPQQVTQLALDGNGASLCLHLDATQLSRAHFAASSDQQSGTVSGLAGTLEHTDYTTILDGWDVTFGDAQPQTFLNVEWSPPAGTTTDVILWVRATGSPATTNFSLDLIDPLE